ncbi:sensor histidine kinase [Paenibacillus sp. GP183]|uniref:cache domain-containing sensor histidine kinase n=1 Tax=Paenibacillus sp. GP183 TaxID=1882751 RepID=UPI000896DA12|nr:sensor histidine kinase [Paenibacillus sp. GP183]SEC75498.1 two-component system, sensor histidine kinase YesM [Paenibacillus sp. GP183]
MTQTPGKPRKSYGNRFCPWMNRWTSSIRYKWMLLLFLFSLTPLLAMGFISFSISKSTINNKVTEYSVQLLKQTADNIDTRLGIYKDMMMQVVNNNEIVSMLRTLDRTDAAQYELDSLSLTTKLSTIIAINQDFQSISFLSQKHYIKGIYRWSDRSNGKVSPFLLTLEDGSNYRWFPTRLGTYVDSLNSQNVLVFSLAKQIYKASDDSPVGIVAVLDVREDVLKEIGTKTTKSNLEIQSFVIDGSGQIISYPDNNLLGKSVKQVLGESGYTQIFRSPSKEFGFPLEHDGHRLIVNYKKLYTNDWIVVNVISESALYKDSNRLLQIIMIIALICIVFSILTAMLLSNSISMPILKMIRLMRQVMSGDLSVRFKAKRRHDEFDILGENFNYMVARIDELLKTVYEEQNHKRVAELKALQAQINPHFLYNTLDIIKWTALLQKANNAAEMVSLLSRLLRISLGKGEETVTVEEEMEHVQCYLGIQKFRFNFNIETFVHLDEDVRMLRTPKLILQPIVENAILHAFTGRESGGEIHISCTLHPEGGIKFEVADNGRGMEPTVAQHLKEHQEQSGEKMGGIGLANVDERIKLICGKPYGIDIQSEIGIGTRIGIRLPIMK